MTEPCKIGETQTKWQQICDTGSKLSSLLQNIVNKSKVNKTKQNFLKKKEIKLSNTAETEPWWTQQDEY